MLAELTPQATVRSKTRRNLRVSYLLAANRAMFLGNAFMQTYYEFKSISTFEVYLLQIVLYATSFVCGTLLGRMGDRHGNKGTLVLGATLALSQSIVFVFCDSFFEFTWTLVAVGIYLTGGWLHAQWGLSAPFLVQPVVYAATVILTLCLVSPRQASRSASVASRTPWQKLARGLFDDVRVRGVIQLTIFCEVLSLTCFWVIQPRMEMAGIGEGKFMWAYLAYAVVLIVTSHYMRYFTHYHLLGWTVAVTAIVGGVVLAGTTKNAWGVVGIFTVVVVHTTLASRLSSDMLRNLLPEGREERTTELSMIGTITQVASGAVGLVFGKCVGTFGLYASLHALVVAAASVGMLTLRSFYLAELSVSEEN